MRIHHLVPLLLLAIGCNGPALTGDVAPTASVGPSTPDAGTPPDGGAQDPAGVTTTAWNSSAPSCVSIAQVAAREPVTVTAKTGSSNQGVLPCGTLVDGIDHLALCSDRSGATPGDHTATDFYALDGTRVASASGHPFAAMPRGFVTAHDAIDYGQRSSITAWTPDASNSLITGGIIPRVETDWCSFAVAPDATIVTACWSSTAGSIWRKYDDALRPLDAGHPTDDHARILAIDRKGLAVVATSAGVRWRDLDGTPVSGPIEGGVPAVQQLIGGGFVNELGALASGATTYTPRPAWMPASPLTLVRGGQAYADVTLADPKGCVERVRVFAPDGTICSTLEVHGTADCPTARLTIGARGSLSEVAGDNTCADLTCPLPLHVWPRILE